MTDEQATALSRAIEKAANSICRDGMPWQTDIGGSVGDMTEATIYVGQQLGRIADSISELSQSVFDSAQAMKGGE